MNPRDGGAALAAARCYNHAAREAAARCPGCGRDYCRACVSAFDHRLLCAACLRAAAAAAAPAPRGAVLDALRPAGHLAAALVVLWAGFYLLGQFLLLPPSPFAAQDYADPAAAPGTRGAR